MVSMREQLARKLHDTHHRAQSFDTCEAACKRHYMMLADTAMTFYENELAVYYERKRRMRHESVHWPSNERDTH